MRINYRMILQNHIFTITEQKYIMLLPFESPTTSKDTTRIARAHQHRNRGRSHKTCLRGFGGNGSIAWTSAVSHVGRTSNAFQVTMKLRTFLFQMVVTSCISVQYLWKYGFAQSSDNLYAPCISTAGFKLNFQKQNDRDESRLRTIQSNSK